MKQIDKALQEDDALRRRREMRFLLLPTRFLSPETMGQCDITVWTNWVCEETDLLMNQLEEELEARGDPDEPFNGTASGVFKPLPPPVQTPRRQGQENVSEHSEPFRDSPRNGETTKMNSVITKPNRIEVQMQGAPCDFSKHSLDLLDPMKSIPNLHIQQ